MNPPFRLFAAIDLPEGVGESLWARTAEPLAQAAGRVGRERLHLTLCFIGAAGEDRLQELSGRLSRVVSPLEAFEMRLDRFGSFPETGKPRVAWAGVERTPPQLVLAAEAIRAAVRQGGFTPDEQPFRAHVTLARFRPDDSTELWKNKTQDSRVFGSALIWKCTRIYLYNSELSCDGVVYKKIFEYLLKYE